MARRPTQRDVAREAAVSVATVCLALKGDCQISRATRDRVEAAAKRVGYVHHPFYSLLGRSRGSGKGMPDLTPVVLLTEATHGFYYSRIPEIAATRGYEVTIHRPEDFAGRSGSRTLYHRGVNAILLGNGCEMVDFEDFDWSPFVVLTLDTLSADVEGHLLRTAVFGPMYELYSRLVERGFQRIGAVIASAQTQPAHPDDLRRHAAYVEASLQVPQRRRLPMQRFGYGEELQNSGYAEYAGRHRPDVVIVHNSGHLLEFQKSKPLPGAALVVRDSDLKWAAGWKMLDIDKINHMLDILERSLRVGATGINLPKVTHQIHPDWNEGVSLNPTVS